MRSAIRHGGAESVLSGLTLDDIKAGRLPDRSQTA